MTTAKKTSTTPKKTAAKKAAEAPQPMDPTIREDTVATPTANAPRSCWAAIVLANEVRFLFPDVPVEYSNTDGRNTNLDVSFDLTTLDSEDSATLITLLSLVDSDARVREVLAEDGTLLVGFKSNPRTQDSRAPFGLNAALDVLNEVDPMDRGSL